MNRKISKKLRKLAAAGVTNDSGPQTSPRRWWPGGTFRRNLKLLKKMYHEGGIVRDESTT